MGAQTPSQFPRSDVGACTEDDALRKARRISEGYQNPHTEKKFV